MYECNVQSLMVCHTSFKDIGVSQLCRNFSRACAEVIGERIIRIIVTYCTVKFFNASSGTRALGIPKGAWIMQAVDFV